MTVGTKAVMGGRHRPVHCCTGIVTAQAWSGPAGDIILRDVINVAVNGQQFVRVTVQTVGRIDSCGNRSGGFRTGAVVTGVTGSGTVGGDVVLGGFDLGPVGNDVTTTTDCSRCFVGQIACPFGYCMGMSGMDRLKTGGVTGRTAAAGSEVFTAGAADQNTVGIVTACTVCVGIGCGAGQGVIVTGGTAGASRAGSGDGDQCGVARGVGGIMDTLPGVGPRSWCVDMTGHTGAASFEVFADSQGLKSAAGGGVTVAAISMCFQTEQIVVVARGTGGASDIHQSIMFRYGHMDPIPNVAVTSRTVATGGEVLSISAVGCNQATVGVVTAGTASVGIGCGAGQSVVVTAGAGGCCNLNQCCVARGVCVGMGGFPVSRMTAGTVA